MTENSRPPVVPHDDCSTMEAARMLGMAVRSVQLMVDRGDLQAWKTPGGHRRIARASVERWLAERPSTGSNPTQSARVAAVSSRRGRLCVLLIEDSAHFQNLISLLVKQHQPDAELHVAGDGWAGVGLAGRLDPDVLIVDILLPGIDGATLITSLRSNPQFKRCRLIVVTSLDEQQRAPYAFALAGVPVIHKTQLVAELPGLLETYAAEAPWVGQSTA